MLDWRQGWGGMDAGFKLTREQILEVYARGREAVVELIGKIIQEFTVSR